MVIAAMEGQDVDTSNTNVDVKIHMRIDGAMAKLLVKSTLRSASRTWCMRMERL